MSYARFIDNTCLNVAKRFIERQPDLPHHQLKIQSTRSNGLPYCSNVTEYVVFISKNRFKELAQIEDADHINTAWEHFKENDHLSVFETKTTDYIRQLGKRYDCARYRIEEDILNIHFRIAAYLITQRLHVFNPLYREPFDRMHEVIQGEMALTHPGAPKPCLATWHLAWCIAFIAYDKIHQIGLLANIDEFTNYDQFYQQVKGYMSPLTYGEASFDYILLGGASSQDIEKLQLAGEEASDARFKFRCVKVIQIIDPTLEIAFSLDVSWGVSMRLARSVVLDTSDPEPLENLKSYEPHLNPDSYFQARSLTIEEARQFQQRRARDKLLTISYSSIFPAEK